MLLAVRRTNVPVLSAGRDQSVTGQDSASGARRAEARRREGLAGSALVPRTSPPGCKPGPEGDTCK